MDIRRAWPLHDNVQDGPRAFGRFMAGAREVDIDDPYWRARLGDGSISLTDPVPAPEPVTGVVANLDGSPVEPGPDGLIHGDPVTLPDRQTLPQLLPDDGSPPVVGIAGPDVPPADKVTP